jgi:hypothetical protein
MNPRTLRIPVLAATLLAAQLAGLPALAADVGRLFYTPAQRAQLEAARTRPAGAPQPAASTPAAAPAPVRFDGVVVRSDGPGTRWVNGRAEVGSGSVAGLKPGQVRADGRVYEPYQVLRPRAPAQDGPSQ